MLHKLRIKNIGKIIIGNLNVAYLPTKFEELKMVVIGKIHILVLTKTHLDESFPTEQFFIEGIKAPYRLDRGLPIRRL